MPSYKCRHPTCTVLLPKGAARFCPRHVHQAPQANAARHRAYDETDRDPVSKKFYNSAAWKAARKAKLAQQPVCERCHREWATLVHHKRPLKDAPELALEQRNLESTCSPCHSRHEGREKARKRRAAA